jgi:hypothetical protein
MIWHVCLACLTSKHAPQLKKRSTLLSPSPRCMQGLLHAKLQNGSKSAVSLSVYVYTWRYARLKPKHISSKCRYTNYSLQACKDAPSEHVQHHVTFWLWTNACNTFIAVIVLTEVTEVELTNINRLITADSKFLFNFTTVHESKRQSLELPWSMHA